MFLFPKVGMFPTQRPTVWEKVIEMIRSYFKPAGTNPEINGPYYELCSYILIVGDYNLKAITLGFEKGSSISKMMFCPIDPTKPIILAANDRTNIGFVCIDQHLKNDTETGMRNYEAFTTDDFIIDCKEASVSGNIGKYWSITSERLTFVYSEKTFPDTWALNNCDKLCAFVACELSVNQLQMHSYLTDREVVKEEKREAYIKHLKNYLDETIRIQNSIHDTLEEKWNLMRKSKLAMAGKVPFIPKGKVLKLFSKNK
jgi:hypothetical protein